MITNITSSFPIDDTSKIFLPDDVDLLLDRNNVIIRIDNFLHRINRVSSFAFRIIIFCSSRSGQHVIGDHSHFLLELVVGRISRCGLSKLSYP